MMFNAIDNANVCANRWRDQELFEQDVRAILRMMCPNRRERLIGWEEYRVGAEGFRATISWDRQFARDDKNNMAVPHMADVLETILVGSVKNQDEISPAEECGIYRSVVRELDRRIDELEDRYA